MSKGNQTGSEVIPVSSPCTTLEIEEATEEHSKSFHQRYRI